MIDRLKPYPTMKDSGVPWLGEVPEHWKIERGKWLFRKMDRPTQDADEVVTCFRDGIVTLRKNRRVRGFTESLKEIGYQGIRRGDLVIHGMDAFAGAIGVADSDGKGTPAYSVCQAGPTANTQYYAYALREMARGQWLQALAKGIRERSTDFRFESFGSQSLPLPLLLEQAAIVRFLDYVDRRIQRYIRAKEKLIALLEEQKQAIINQAVTGQIDVRTGHPYPAYKDSSVEWLGQVPEHWEVIPFKRRVGFQEGPGIMAADFRESGIPLLRISCLREELATLNGCNYLDPEMVALRWNHFAIRRGDYLLSASASTGEVSLATADVVGAIPYTGIIRLWGRSQKAIMEYVRLFMISGLFQDQIYRAKSGVGIEHFGPKHLNRMIITLPSVAEQEAIVGVCQEAIAPLAGAIAGARREIALLREYRTRLIADVVTGKLDVRDAAAGLPEVDPLARGDVDDPLDTDMDSVLEELETVKEVTI